jgi:hypothetical protein
MSIPLPEITHLRLPAPTNGWSQRILIFWEEPYALRHLRSSSDRLRKPEGSFPVDRNLYI